jgi:hypothetical protein
MLHNTTSNFHWHTMLALTSGSLVCMLMCMRVRLYKSSLLCSICREGLKNTSLLDHTLQTALKDLYSHHLLHKRNGNQPCGTIGDEPTRTIGKRFPCPKRFRYTDALEPSKYFSNARQRWSSSRIIHYTSLRKANLQNTSLHPRSCVWKQTPVNQGDPPQHGTHCFCVLRLISFLRSGLLCCLPASKKKLSLLRHCSWWECRATKPSCNKFWISRARKPLPMQLYGAKWIPASCKAGLLLSSFAKLEWITSW